MRELCIAYSTEHEELMEVITDATRFIEILCEHDLIKHVKYIRRTCYAANTGSIDPETKKPLRELLWSIAIHFNKTSFIPERRIVIARGPTFYDDYTRHEHKTAEILLLLLYSTYS